MIRDLSIVCDHKQHASYAKSMLIPDMEALGMNVVEAVQFVAIDRCDCDRYFTRLVRDAIMEEEEKEDIW